MDQDLRAQEKEAEEAQVAPLQIAEEVTDVSQALKYAPHAEALEEFLQVKVLHLK